MAKEVNEFEKIKKIFFKENTMHNEVTLLEYTQYLKNKYVLESKFIMITLLNSFLKKLYLNEGIDDNSDDVYRPIYAQ